VEVRSQKRCAVLIFPQDDGTHRGVGAGERSDPVTDRALPDLAL
jgi:hypothetical protein